MGRRADRPARRLHTRDRPLERGVAAAAHPDREVERHDPHSARVALSLAEPRRFRWRRRHGHIGWTHASIAERAGRSAAGRLRDRAGPWCESAAGDCAQDAADRPHLPTLTCPGGRDRGGPHLDDHQGRVDRQRLRGGHRCARRSRERRDRGRDPGRHGAARDDRRDRIERPGRRRHRHPGATRRRGHAHRGPPRRRPAQCRRRIRSRRLRERRARTRDRQDQRRGRHLARRHLPRARRIQARLRGHAPRRPRVGRRHRREPHPRHARNAGVRPPARLLGAARDHPHRRRQDPDPAHHRAARDRRTARRSPRGVAGDRARPRLRTRSDHGRRLRARPARRLHRWRGDAVPARARPRDGHRRRSSSAASSPPSTGRSSRAASRSRSPTTSVGRSSRSRGISSSRRSADTPSCPTAIRRCSSSRRSSPRWAARRGSS